MANLDELINQFQQVVDQIEQAISEASGADQNAGELQSMYAGAGDEHKASMMASIKAGVDSLRTYLQGGVDQGSELIQQTEAVKSGSG